MGFSEEARLAEAHRRDGHAAGRPALLSGAHILTDLTLGLGTVAYDYLG